MSQDFVTRDELQRFEERIEAQRVAFETRIETQWKRFMGEVNGHIVRISEDAQSGRHDLIESNQAMVMQFHKLEARIDRAEEGANRHRESTAARIGGMEESFKDVREISRTVVATLKELGEQVEDLKRAVQAQANS